MSSGGTPSASDRAFATQLGVAAVDFLVAGGAGRMVCHKDNAFSSVALAEVAGKVRRVPPHHPLVESARAIGVSFGDAGGRG